MRRVGVRVGDVIVRMDPMRRGDSFVRKGIEILGLDRKGNLRVTGSSMFHAHGQVNVIYKQNFDRFFTEVCGTKVRSYYSPRGAGEEIATVAVSCNENWEDSISYGAQVDA